MSRLLVSRHFRRGHINDEIQYQKQIRMTRGAGAGDRRTGGRRGLGFALVTRATRNSRECTEQLGRAPAATRSPLRDGRRYCPRSNPPLTNVGSPS